MKLKLLILVLIAVIAAGCAQNIPVKSKSPASKTGVEIAWKVKKRYESAKSVEGLEPTTRT